MFSLRLGKNFSLSALGHRSAPLGISKVAQYWVYSALLLDSDNRTGPAHPSLCGANSVVLAVFVTVQYFFSRPSQEATPLMEKNQLRYFSGPVYLGPISLRWDIKRRCSHQQKQCLRQCVQDRAFLQSMAGETFQGPDPSMAGRTLSSSWHLPRSWTRWGTPEDLQSWGTSKNPGQYND